ncbi:hypothetical protein CS0771_36260 [Catellatospora sp. IY07-71]|uniref:hypothetical protein n=1 Tax=Catellatospora sp. IY07-71 TaxID=2728827 RepID=UPI001BB3DBFE|nr:hypothetical protein [Catellatospora sp. IY07-71]BCJ74082.1 hypothetical protein CS0771_36260 [Catellatospora sp. IY07-71]
MSAGTAHRAAVRPRRLAAWGAAALNTAWWAVPGVALLLGLHALRLSDVTDIGSLGLVSALRPEFCGALALLTISFLSGVLRARPAPGVLLAAHVVVLAVLLFGAATIIEPLPRFISGWLHVGFADYVARTGETLPYLDARFNWPGFFTLAAMATRAAGMPDAMPLLGWTPVVLNLLYGAIVFRLARAVSPEPRTAWLALWLFLPANWVGQDYFGPQALNYAFYLIVLTVLVVWFRPRRLSGGPDPSSRRAGLLHALRLPAEPLLHEPESPRLGRAATAGLMVGVLVIFTASAASHQLTPVAIVAAVAALALAGRCRARSLPVLLGVILVAYISYLTVPYWSGHLEAMFGSVGNVTGTISSGAVQRVRGDDGHLAVVLVRLGFTAAVWVLAAAGAWRRLRTGHGDLALLALAGAPFAVLALQSYGGEAILRVYAFGLPFMVVLLAALFVPTGQARSRAVAAVTAVAVSAAFTAAFFVARYGNESFEQVRPNDVQAVDWLYAHAQPGATLVAVTSNVPWRSRHIERYAYRPLGLDLGPSTLPAIEQEMRRDAEGAYLLLTRGQYVFAESYLGMPAGWGEQLELQVRRSSRFRLVYANPDASIYVLLPASKVETDDKDR